MTSSVSVIIPTYNRANTLGETLDSLLSQTRMDWEAIIVDDGSSDDTPLVARQYSARDARIRFLRQANAGPAAARQAGTQLARGKWLLYLDSDDWIAPQHLERLAGILEADPGLDAVTCGWDRVTPAGKVIPGNRLPAAGDLFPALATHPVFPIHACLVRRERVEAAGGWDAAHAPCEDWDLWQRVARTGAVFAAAPEVLAFYRMSPDAASIDSRRMLADGLSIIQNGFGPDPRVKSPAPRHATGRPPADLPFFQYGYLGWCAGLELGKMIETAGPVVGSFDHSLMEPLKSIPCPDIDPQTMADCIFQAALLPGAHALQEWGELWPKIDRPLSEFLQALEAQSGSVNLVRSTRAAVERLIAAQLPDERLPAAIGSTFVTRLEAAGPLEDIFLPEGCERFYAHVELQGRRLGAVELPACAGRVTAYVLSDAIAAQFAWELLGAFFTRRLYANLRLEQEPEGWSLWRGDLRLAAGLADPHAGGWAQAHDVAGWTLLMQELWGQTDLLDWQFYLPKYPAPSAGTLNALEGWVEIEASGELPTVKVSAPELQVILKVGGAALGVAPVASEAGQVRPETLRVALSTATGFELCVAAVRAGVVGLALDDPRSLRQRLQQAAPPQAALPGGAAVILGRRDSRSFGLPASRRAVLPISALPAAQEAASVAGEPVRELSTHQDRAEEIPEHLFYIPEMISRSAPVLSQPAAALPAPGAAHSTGEDRRYDRSHFERIFSGSDNPWRYTSQYEQAKYAQTLALLPPGRFRRVLELACAEGHFTVQIAPRADSLIAADISQIALLRAAQRCAGLDHIQFQHLDMAAGEIPAPVDLIVCSEVLYYMGSRKNLERVARKLGSALAPHGYLVTAHARLIVDEPESTGFDWDVPYGSKTIGETLAKAGGLRLLRELRTPLYRIQLFQRPARVRRLWHAPKPEIREQAEIGVPLLPHLAEHIVWQGSSRTRQNYQGAGQEAVTTSQLPVLMYHRIAPAGSERLGRYRLSPQCFEDQLQYLRSAGFYSIDCVQWSEACSTRRPLPGRAILITFDDGYQDFAEYAWPLLQKYGFHTLVFLVAGAVGGSNSWDASFGEQVPLLDWETLVRLQGEGVRFGAHSLDHSRLTALGIPEITRQLAAGRAILEARLGARLEAFAYPYGDQDPVVQHIAGACGFNYGFTCKPGRSTFRTPLLSLHRFEVSGDDSLETFIARLGE